MSNGLLGAIENDLVDEASKQGFSVGIRRCFISPYLWEPTMKRHDFVG
jgi:hypothetical protein